MGQGEQGIAARVCGRIKELFRDLEGMPSIKSDSGAMASLETAKGDFEEFVRQFIEPREQVLSKPQ